MTDNVEGLVLKHLKALRSEVKDLRGAMLAEFKDVKHRLAQLEVHSVGSRRNMVSAQDDVYRQQSSLDRLAERVERIERRLELA